MGFSPFKQTSAWLPVAMSLTALAVVLGHIAIYGAVREADEGATAHIFQLLMAGQVPVVMFFAFRWLRERPKQALQVLAVQVVAGLAAMGPVYYYNL